MKRVRCPKCQTFITFDETRYRTGQSLVFECPSCGKQFSIRLGVSKLRNKQDDEHPDKTSSDEGFGTITVIESPYHYKQVIPLHMGDNVIGRMMRGNDINCPIETGDLNIDLTHCVITVSRNAKGKLKYVLRDGPSYGGTFVGPERLAPREQRVLQDGDLFTIGVTSVILNTEDEK